MPHAIATNATAPEQGGASRSCGDTDAVSAAEHSQNNTGLSHSGTDGRTIETPRSSVLQGVLEATGHTSVQYKLVWCVKSISLSSPLACREQATHAFWTQRRFTHTHSKRPQGILHGIRDRRWRCDSTAFAHPLNAKGVAWRGMVEMDEFDLWDFGSAGQQIIHQRATEQLPGIIIDQVLIEPAAN